MLRVGQNGVAESDPPIKSEDDVDVESEDDVVVEFASEAVRNRPVLASLPAGKVGPWLTLLG